MWALVPALLVLGTLPTPAAEAHVAVAVSLPAGFDAIALTDAEVSLATEQGGSIAKAQFQRGEISGTVVLVTSGSWLAQHLPRHCLRAAGVALTGEFPTLVDGEPIRWAEIATNGHSGRAAWWFQSADHITDDHTERIWLGMGDDTPWTLVSIVIDQPVQPDHPEVVTLVTDLRSHLLESL